jgi:hypothetical protein
MAVRSWSPSAWPRPLLLKLIEFDMAEQRSIRRSHGPKLFSREFRVGYLYLDWSLLRSRSKRRSKIRSKLVSVTVMHRHDHASWCRGHDSTPGEQLRITVKSHFVSDIQIGTRAGVGRPAVPGSHIRFDVKTPENAFRWCSRCSCCANAGHRACCCPIFHCQHAKRGPLRDLSATRTTT